MSATSITTTTVTLEEAVLQDMLSQATRIGAEMVFKKYVRYNFTQAAELLSITPKTLSKRVSEGKIRAVDGLISGSEIDRYLGHSQ